MPSELSVHAIYQSGMHIVASAGKHSVIMDYPLRSDDVAGLTPLQLVLASLAGCGGSTVALLLQRMRQPLKGLEVEVRGKRRDEHPTVFTEISLEFIVQGSGVDPEAVAKVLEQAEDRLCPVWAMLKPGTTITSSFRIVED
jgi:putative redox protein